MMSFPRKASALTEQRQPATNKNARALHEFDGTRGNADNDRWFWRRPSLVPEARTGSDSLTQIIQGVSNKEAPVRVSRVNSTHVRRRDGGLL